MFNRRHKPAVIRHLHTEWPIVRTLEGERNPDIWPAAITTWAICFVGAVILFTVALIGGTK